MVKNPLSRMWKDRCSVYEKKNEPNESGKMQTVEQLKYKNLPCRVSFNSSPAASTNEFGEFNQSITLFISQKYVIKPGSRIEVSRFPKLLPWASLESQTWQDMQFAWNGGNFYAFYASGKTKLYSFHQEIALVLDERWV